MSLKSVEGKRLSDILRSPANVDIDLDQKSALVNFATAIDAAPALAKIHRSTILGRRLQTVLDIEFPRSEEQFKGAATGYVGDIQTAQHIFNRYLQQENAVDTRTVIRLRCTEYPVNISPLVKKKVFNSAPWGNCQEMPHFYTKRAFRQGGFDERP